MYICYEDILSKVSESPTWWSNGVPRYGKFQPWAVDIYASAVALIHTKCVCGTDYFQGVVVKDKEIFKNRVMAGDVGMGDPPNACDFLTKYDCGDASTTCREIRVVEYWERDRNSCEWIRLPELEMQLTDHFLSAPIWQPVNLTADQLALVQTAYQQGGKIAAIAIVIDITQIDMVSVKYWADNHF